MNILLCNDDGIHAPGISVLYDAVKPLGELSVIAPDAERSAAGHAITLTDPIKSMPVEKNGRFFGYAIGGTPADCIKLAVNAILPGSPPDLVLSGINLGSNTGISVIYSGTVSAATEAVVLGIPGIAFSLCTYTDPDWDTAGRVARELVHRIPADSMPPGVLLNVNIPNLPWEDIRGIRITRMGRSRFIEKFDRRLDPHGRTYYWLDGELEVHDDGEDIDIRAVNEGFVSVTPIHLDLTATAHLETFRYLETGIPF